MRLLALDTSSIACSVALQLDDAVSELHEEQPREHTAILMPMIESVLQTAGASTTELDAIVLGNGPGSFIGMRIAASVAQGLAFASGLRIVPVSSLAAVAEQVFAEHGAAEVVVTQDAHMHEVYLGVYRQHDDTATAVLPECLHDIAAIDAGDDRPLGPRVAAGFGWRRYPELLVANQENFDAVVDVLHPRARHLLRLGAAGLESGRAIDPRDVSPAYLRQKVAARPAGTP
ncbi:MAG: tRNA (adenosine(37)-N6)-threonylcarbamoyltransferase complex dimerization subunit type 1 TsaB [Gammaproteobacteria bacterium]|nr:tRNA (adenosine(37)-N6)-threonylcarbamoyltransferase complex dimerization subunit type 1 TsaB [Gammaproteobacteria bacterium]MDH3410671.1 tRNA (adenosine(37)-N6)-threonylcarbamoyltransferase complex dimerization subunit type 1 TsaB [Gammaproteobacteria bacterium]